MHIITWYKTTGTNIRPVSVLLLLGLCLFVFFALHLFFTVFTHGTLYYSIHVCVRVCLFHLDSGSRKLYQQPAHFNSHCVRGLKWGYI